MHLERARYTNDLILLPVIRECVTCLHPAIILSLICPLTSVLFGISRIPSLKQAPQNKSDSKLQFAYYFLTACLALCGLGIILVSCKLSAVIIYALSFIIKSCLIFLANQFTCCSKPLTIIKKPFDYIEKTLHKEDLVRKKIVIKQYHP